MTRKMFAWVMCALVTTTEVSAQAPRGTPVRIDARPRLSVGVVEGDTMQELHRVVSPFTLPDGRLVVPLETAGTIRIFSTKGEFLKSFGRIGSGPGEFRYITSAWPRGDTIEVLDGGLQRITRILPDGKTETVKLEKTQPDLSASAGVYGSGWVAGGVAKGGTGRRDSVVVRRFDRTGKDLGEIAMVPGMARFKGAMFTGPEPLSPRSVHAVRNDRVYIGESLTPRIRVFAAGGAPAKDIVWQPARVMTVRQALNLVLDSAVARAGPRAVQMRQHITGAPVRDTLPVFWQVVVDAAGFAWVKPYDPLTHSFALGAKVGPGGRWLIFAPDGRQAGTIDVPATLEPVFITADAVVGIALDEFGVESVHVHALTRRNP